MQENPSPEEKGLAGPVKNLIYDVIGLLLLHIKFFKEATKETFFALIKFVVLGAVAAFICITGCFFVGVFLILLFSLIMPLWLAALTVTASYFLTALVLFIYAVSQLKTAFKHFKVLAEETEKTLKEIQKWPSGLTS